MSARANDGPKAVSAWSLDTMQTRFRDVGHLPTLFSAFLYFDMSFMVWVLLGPLGVQIGHSLHLKPAQLGFMVAIPVLSGALLRVLNGFLVDQFRPRRVGIAMQIVVILALASACSSASPARPSRSPCRSPPAGIPRSIKARHSASQAPAIQARCSPRSSRRASPSPSAGPTSSASRPPC
jgi:hypothetical protein